MRKYYEIRNEEVYLVTGIYAFTHNTLVKAMCRDGEPYGALTVNLDVKLESPDLAYLNINLWGVDVEKFITENGLGEKVAGRERRSGYLTYPLYRLNLKNL